MLAAIIMAAPCTASAPIDAGKVAPCDGVLISATRAQQAIADKREVNLRRTFECAPCPDCPKDDGMRTAAASFFSGFVLGLLLILVR